MWGATDLAYVMWLMIHKPGLPFFSQVRIFATVTDVHISSAASAFLSTFAMPLLALMRPGYFGTPLGHTLLITHEYAIVFLIFITIVTGAVYEWYAAEMVTACKPKFVEGGVGGGEILSAGVVSAGMGGVCGVAGAASQLGTPQSPPGTLDRRYRLTPMTVLSHGLSFARVYAYLIRMLPWLWAPITAVMYLLGPSAWAQTILIFYNRQRKPHVSPKSSPTPLSTPRPGATPINGFATSEPSSPMASASHDEIIAFNASPVGSAVRPQSVRLNLPAHANGTSMRRGDSWPTQQ